MEFGVSAGTTALIAALQPLMAAALAGPVLGEYVGRQQWAGLAVGIVGVALVVGGDVRVAEAPLWAYAMPFAGMAGLVAATLVERKESTSERAVSRRVGRYRWTLCLGSSAPQAPCCLP